MGHACAGDRTLRQVTQTTSTAGSSTSRVKKWSTTFKRAVVIIAMLLIVVKLSSSDLSNKSFTVLQLAWTPLLQQSFEGSIIPKRGLVRFPYERLPRRMQPRSFHTPEFLHESNVNTTTIDLSQGEVRVFQPHGIGMHFYMHLGSYRSSPREFSNVGSTPRGLLSYVHPVFKCTWIDTNGTEVGAKDVQVHRPAGPFDGAYDALVIICQFEHDVGVERGGGELWITYTADRFRSPERFLAFREAPGDYNATVFEPPFPYDVVYCGSPIFGNVSPQRIREWLAYHAYVFGPRSHIILYDAGGFSPDVLKVVQPWVDLGRVTVENIQQTDLYHGYYHHQHMIVNDCMFKSQFMANWTFFFDVDEYLVVEPIHSLTNFLAEKAAKGIVSFMFDQKRMSTSLCADMHVVHDAAREAVNSMSVPPLQFLSLSSFLVHHTQVSQVPFLAALLISY